LKSFQTPALPFIFEVLSKNPAYHESLYKLFTSYNDFLGILNDGSARAQLENLPMKAAYADETFGKARKISHDFQEALKDIFFIKDGPLKDFTIKYGVF
jgi:hypothetical protein